MCARAAHGAERDSERGPDTRGESNPASAREWRDPRDGAARERVFSCCKILKHMPSNRVARGGPAAPSAAPAAWRAHPGARGGRSSLPPLVRGGRGAVALAIAVGVASWFAASPQGLCGTGCTPLLCPPLPHARVSVFCALWVCVLLLLLLLLLLFRRSWRRRGVRGRRGRRREPRPVRGVRVLVLEHHGKELARLLPRRNGHLDPVPAGWADEDGVRR